ncbi:acetate/propionate family kinase [Ramlibacter sp. PS3R-8]|uniref:acetate/propionate family kinase n=1 Tax=Ramlibacter sp. PS3R-8 TaxID=3133437 RepID=UPI0030A42B3E
MNHFLALNFGSASLKYALFAEDGTALAHSIVDRPADVRSALDDVCRGLPKEVARLTGIGHRVVHGGRRHAPVLFDAAVESEIESLLDLAPQHNRLSLDAVRSARALWPQTPQVAVFDTAFHSGMPEHASCYAVPAAWRDAGLRRYGFHGLSHEHVMQAVAGRLGRPAADLKIMSCHLGNGASVCAIEHGRSVDTSMGLTPLEGLVMGTRCGDIDPGAPGFIHRELGLTLPEIERMLYQESGLAALGGHGGDMRLIEESAVAGDAGARLALAAYAYRIRKYIGAYAAAMGGCDAVAFTGGIGENSAGVRASVMRGMEFLGLVLDPARNGKPLSDAAGVAELQVEGSPAAILSVQAREEWMVFRGTQLLLAATAN